MTDFIKKEIAAVMPKVSARKEFDTWFDSLSNKEKFQYYAEAKGIFGAGGLYDVAKYLVLNENKETNTD